MSTTKIGSRGVLMVDANMTSPITTIATRTSGLPTA
jgi:hypothetical protein